MNVRRADTTTVDRDIDIVVLKSLEFELRQCQSEHLAIVNTVLKPTVCLVKFCQWF
jgi:hypothetical protein